MNGYVAFYNQRRIEVYADTSYEAQQKAAEQLKVPPRRRHQVTVCLAEKNGEQVVHRAVD